MLWCREGVWPPDRKTRLNAFDPILQLSHLLTRPEGTYTARSLSRCTTSVQSSGAVPRLSSVSAFSSETAVALGMRWWTSAGSASTDSIESLLGP